MLKCLRLRLFFLMYDKDGFPSDKYDNTQYSAENRKSKRQYRVAWSNESFELWFVLHLQDLKQNIGREEYMRILHDFCGYKKNDEALYEFFKPMMEVAINRAKKQYEAYPADVPPSSRCPATRVFELVEYLKRYL